MTETATGIDPHRGGLYGLRPGRSAGEAGGRAGGEVFGGMARLPLRAVFVVVLAAVTKVMVQRGDETVVTGLLGVAIAFGALSLVMFRSLRRLGSLFPLVFAASFVDYKLILEARFSFGPLPLNVIDGGIALAGMSMVGYVFVRRRAPAAMRPTTALLVLFGIFSVAAFLGGAVANGWYDAFRDFRVFLYLVVSYVITRTHLHDWRVPQVLVHVILLGGIYGMVALVLERVQALALAGHYTALRALGRSTAPVDFAFTVAIAFLICKQSISKKAWATPALCVLGILWTILSFSLTPYAFLILIPALCFLLAPIGVRRKGDIITLVVIAALIAAVLLAAFWPLVWRYIGTFVQQSFQDPSHVGSRLVTWSTAWALLDGWRVVTGRGMGTRKFVDDDAGGFVIGEPTYATFLIGTGLIGVLLLVLLQANFIMASFRAMRRGGSKYGQATWLAFVVYGIVIMLNGVLHNTFMSPQISVLYGVLFAIGTSTGPRQNRSHRDPGVIHAG